MENSSECCFCPDKTTNAARGPTDKQPDETPFDRKLREGVSSTVKGATSNPQSGMSMPDKPFATQQ